jgi:hypothetical protein
MTSICYPPGADWSCAYDADEMDTILSDPVTGALAERANALGWSTLASLTGHRLSLCPITIRPCAAGCGSGSVWSVAPTQTSFAGAAPGGTFRPQIGLDGQWYNACGCSPDACSCTSLCEVILPQGVGHIESVSLDGSELDPTAYRVDNGNRLVRQDGLCWPYCQDMRAPADGVGSFTVSYYPGVAPDDLLRYAAGILATEFYKACSNQKCRLPAAVTSVVRQGVQFEIASGIFMNGSSGIREVDAVVAIYNPYGLRTPPRVLSPDRRSGRVQTWSA